MPCTFGGTRSWMNTRSYCYWATCFCSIINSQGALIHDCRHSISICWNAHKVHWAGEHFIDFRPNCVLCLNVCRSWSLFVRRLFHLSDFFSRQLFYYLATRFFLSENQSIFKWAAKREITSVANVRGWLYLHSEAFLEYLHWLWIAVRFICKKR